MKKNILKKRNGEKSELKGFVKIGEHSYIRNFFIDATNADIYEYSIKGKLVLEFDEFNFDDLIELFDDGFNTLLFHVSEGECNYVQE